VNTWNDIAAAIATATGKAFSVDSRVAIGGGCINSASRVASNGRTYFVKTNTAAKAGMFAAEAAGLAEIDATKTVRVPQPVCPGPPRSTAICGLATPLSIRTGRRSSLIRRSTMATGKPTSR